MLTCLQESLKISILYFLQFFCTPGPPLKKITFYIKLYYSVKVRPILDTSSACILSIKKSKNNSGASEHRKSRVTSVQE